MDFKIHTPLHPLYNFRMCEYDWIITLMIRLLDGTLDLFYFTFNLLLSLLFLQLTLEGKIIVGDADLWTYTSPVKIYNFFWRNQEVSKRKLKCGRGSAKKSSLLLALWMEGAMGQGTKNSHWSWEQPLSQNSARKRVLNPRP